ncbi:hypothetical protein P5673_015743 [Acropora cervicornis]|uniref:MADF domain-containing protein n=1 Tax=Acropora cervicornis TaxID=6130 RepID=A0AAD9QHZ5_ACRCE|nr:hypothetical protein P5673_015743 [Acropora cervicornis]
MATQINEKLAESVRNYPCLYDKKSADFKDKNKKALAWSDVAKEVGLQNGDEACKLFQYLRNKYSRDKKKIEGKKVSGSSTDEVREAKVEASSIQFQVRSPPSLIPER